MRSVQPTQLVQGFDGSRIQRCLVAVADFDGQGLVAALAGDHLHAVCADFGNPIAPADFHESQVIAPNAAHHLRIGRHGLAQLRKALAKLGVLGAAGQARIAVGQLGQGHGVVGR